MLNNTTPLTPDETKNCSENITYLIKCIFPNGTMPSKSYKKGKTIPGLDISLSTLNNARRGAYISNNTASKIASAFSFYCTGSNNNGMIKIEDLMSDPENFKKKFPPNCFKQKEENKKSVDLTLFSNKIYRGYYMLRNSSYKAYMAYFWFFEEKNGSYSAAMLRGISDFEDVKEFTKEFKDIKQIRSCFKDKVHEYKKRKSTASIHFYFAEPENIRYSPSCIQINFRTEEAAACYSTMYWNIDIVSKSAQSVYAGGSALMVDTNEGARGKDICAFKFGLECIENLIEKAPLNNTAPQVIAELMPKTKNGILLVDNADDANWYRFISEKTFRNNTPEAYLKVDPLQLIMNLANLEHKCALRYDELNELVTKVKDILDPGQQTEKQS